MTVEMAPNTLLAIGGPKDGEQLEDKGDTRTIFGKPIVENPLGLSPALTSRYIKRYLPGEIDGRNIHRPVYVHESVSGWQEVMVRLANILIGEWLLGGEEFVPEPGTGPESDPSPESHSVVPDRNGGGSNGVAGPEPRSPLGLYLPG